MAHSCLDNRGPTVYGTMQKVNEVFVVGLESFARGASLRSYKKFVSSRSDVNFIIP